MQDCRTLLKKKPKLYSEELVNHLFFDFYTKNEYLRERLGISRNTASKYLNELEEIGLLTSEQVGKEKIFLREAMIFSLLSALALSPMSSIRERTARKLTPMEESSATARLKTGSRSLLRLIPSMPYSMS